MKVGGVGFEAWGKFHARGWGQVAGAELVAMLAHGDGSAAEAGAAFPGVTVYRELGALLGSGVEVVDVDQRPTAFGNPFYCNTNHRNH